MKTLLVLAMALSMLACGADRGPRGRPGWEDLQGRWVVVNYLAQRCKPCIEEIPELNALARQYPVVTVLGVNYDGATGAELERQEKMLGVDFPTLPSDPAGRLGTRRPVVLPTTLVINPEGELLTTLTGPQTLESLARITGQAP